MKKEIELLKGETFLPIKDYENLYEVSNLGRIKGLPKEFKLYHGGIVKTKTKLLKPSKRGGYEIIVFYNKSSRKTFSIHRLVAIAFIPNNENKKQINHKNGIRSDNNISNLEWCTGSENIRHAYDVLKRESSWKNRKKKVL